MVDEKETYTLEKHIELIKESGLTIPDPKKATAAEF
jgi:hypothetical protein